MDQAPVKSLQQTIAAMKVLVIDDEQYMRKVVRTLLFAIGVRTVYEADQGDTGLDAIRRYMPDLVIVDWEMPMIDGAEFVRMVRSPDHFPYPDVPIIMLSGHGDRWRVVEAASIGAHEYLLKPVSAKALRERIAAIVTVPRPFITLDGYYGPAPRRLVTTGALALPGSPQPGAARPATSRHNPARTTSAEVAVKSAAIGHRDSVVLS